MTIAARFAAIIEGLCRAVAARGAKGAFGPASQPLVILLWSRLRRMAARFAILAEGAPKPRPRARRAGPRKRVRGPDLPRRRAWLLAPVPEATAAASQLRALLDDPQARALIAADPRFARLLRPLCRALFRRPPAIPAPPAPARPAAPRHRAVPATAAPHAAAAPPATPPLFHPPPAIA
ncbi:hypothetical protein [Acidiphilium multivorum]|uniref:Uncharacterized protein n=3 Tax=Acidiphilium TaxID=522 RepID=F0J5B4_ACIMA|nr:hypothetical protein [Acidiphilium multivorum]MBS3022350.1 hypothetical protein [Acidiphilium multivorum]UNC12759.1 hypothetical protein FE249_00215 [Acidiphilium multivorum]BAJ80163.1 hypothetical protein ACMV_08160 [Acidiphilium multivorum AIU301]